MGEKKGAVYLFFLSLFGGGSIMLRECCPYEMQLFQFIRRDYDKTNKQKDVVRN